MVMDVTIDPIEGDFRASECPISPSKSKFSMSHGIENRGHKSSLITDTQVRALGFRVRPSTDSEIMQDDTGPIFGLEKGSFINELQQRKM